MVKANELITVINRYQTPDRLDVYRCHTIQGVSWYAQNKYAVDDSGLKAAKLYKVRIPKENAPGYLPPGEYQAAGAPEDTWTLRPGDKIVRGVVETIAGAKFAALTRTHEAFVVLDAHVNEYGFNPHYYVEGG